MKTILLLRRGLWLFLLAGVSLGATPPYQENYIHRMTIGDRAFVTEIADTPERMQQGMMFRPQMQGNQAMLFPFFHAQQAAFWMKNTLIPLDMLFFNTEGRLLEIKHQLPPCRVANCPIYRSHSQKVRFVVELKGGVSKQLELQVGDQLGWAKK